MARGLEQRPCGETRGGADPAHRYMLGRTVYQCPGGDVRPPDSVAGSPCPLRALRKPHDAHDFRPTDESVHCPGYAEPDNGPGPEPSLSQTDAERIRDLEHTLQRVREALGTETPAATCDGHHARITALETTLRDVLAQFVHAGHPGEPCKQTGWIRAATLDRWHTVLRGEPTP